MEHLTGQPKVEQFYSPELKRVFTEDEAEKVQTPLGIQWKLEGKPTSHFGRESFAGEKPIPMPMALYQEGRRAFGLPEIAPEDVGGEHLTESSKVPEGLKTYLKKHIIQSLKEAGVDW